LPFEPYNSYMIVKDHRGCIRDGYSITSSKCKKITVIVLLGYLFLHVCTATATLVMFKLMQIADDADDDYNQSLIMMIR